MATAFTGYWRDGKKLVMDRNAVLPDRCVKCNEAANGYRRTLKLQHVSTGAHLAFGAIAYALAKRAAVDVGLCERHRRSNRLTIGLISAAILIASFAVLTQPMTSSLTLSLLATAGLIGGVIGIIVALVRGPGIRATKITETHVWLTGIGEAFLAATPNGPVLAPDDALPTLAASRPTPIAPEAAADLAYRNVRTGAVTFAIGALITLATYLALAGTYLIAWGPMAFGLYRLVSGARTYLKVPPALRTSGQLLTLGGMLAIGVAAGGWVALQEYETNAFADSIDKAFASQQAGAKLFADVMNRPGTWTSTDASDMGRVATYYGQAADTVQAATPPASLGWYHDGLVKNFHEAVDIATGFSGLTATSPKGAADALIQRWLARVRELNDLQSRLDAQVK